MLDIFVTKIRLQRPGIVPSVGEGVAAGMPKHVGMWLEAELRLDSGPFYHPRKAGAAERSSPL
jgi:hypothetical protein